MKIVSYNLNGVRAANKLGIMNFVKEFDADIYCFQEVRAGEQVAEEVLRQVFGYHLFINSGERPGYSGTAILSKIKPIDYEFGMGEGVDVEGRTITLFFEGFVLINCYVPNGTKRLDFKLDFTEKLGKYMESLAKKYNVILCSDINTAHTEKDLSHPKANSARSGFLPIERDAVSDLLNRGFLDVLREFNPDKQLYSWRSYGSRLRDKYPNFTKMAWLFRFDYILVNRSFFKQVKNVEILDKEYSDHLPIVVEINY